MTNSDIKKVLTVEQRAARKAKNAAKRNTKKSKTAETPLEERNNINRKIFEDALRANTDPVVIRDDGQIEIHQQHQPISIEKFTLETYQGPKIDTERIKRRRKEARAYVDELMQYEPRSPEFQAALQNRVINYGTTEIKESANLSSDLLNTKESMLTKMIQNNTVSKRASGSDEMTPGESIGAVVAYLNEVSPESITWRRRILGMIPYGGPSLEVWFSQFDTVRRNLEVIQKHMEKTDQKLEDTNLSLQTTQLKIWNSIESLLYSMHGMDEMKKYGNERITKLIETNPQKAALFESRMQSAIVRHERMLLEHLSIADLGYSTMEENILINAFLREKVTEIQSNTIPLLSWSAMNLSSLMEADRVLKNVSLLKATGLSYAQAVNKVRENMSPELIGTMSTDLDNISDQLSLMEQSKDISMKIELALIKSVNSNTDAREKMLEGMSRINKLQAENAETLITATKENHAA